MGYGTSRFDSPTSDLNLTKLFSGHSRNLWISFGLAISVHLLLTQITGWRERQEVSRPLTTQFVKRRPRLSKPLELRKRPRPKRRRMRREMVSVAAKVQRKEMGGNVRPLAVLGQLARPAVEVSRIAGFQGTLVEPKTAAQEIMGQKETKSVVDMSLEMLDVTDLDTGRYHAMVIQDPSDKRNIRGFLRLRYAYSKTMEKPDFRSQLDRMAHGTLALIEAMNQYTDIQARFEGRILFTSKEMLKTPWAFSYIAEAFEFPHEELNALGAYLVAGGFMLCDVWSRVRHPEGLGHRRPAIAISAAHHNFKRALDTQGLRYGQDWRFEMLSHDHPIYHCFFDFEGVPAGHWDEEFTFAGDLRGLYFDGRWLLAMCQKGLLHLWDDPRYPEMRSERLIQFGINTIIFALTQEGSITHRVMDEIR